MRFARAVRAGHHDHVHDLKPRRETERTRKGFERVRRAEQQYARGLRGIARHLGELARGFAPDSPHEVSELEQSLRRYAEFITPWAEKHAARMLADVSRRDEAVWAQLSKEMSRALRKEILEAPTGALLRGFLEENVTLIRSLPIEAAQRVHELTIEGLTSAKRPEEIAKEILRTGEVSVGRANTIARTEVARTSSGLVMARSIHVGSEGYIWRDAGDSDVRKSHKQMNGKFVRWDSPPTLDNLVGHAGQLPNCRCYPEPVIPEEPQ
jgi:SPP1 gp7 family putative phage head morphogenesis protein